MCNEFGALDNIPGNVPAVRKICAIYTGCKYKVVKIYQIVNWHRLFFILCLVKLIYPSLITTTSAAPPVGIRQHRVDFFSMYYIFVILTKSSGYTIQYFYKKILELMVVKHQNIQKHLW